MGNRWSHGSLCDSQIVPFHTLCTEYLTTGYFILHTCGGELWLDLL